MNIQLSPQDEHLREMGWSVTPDGYVRRDFVVDGQRRYELMHRVVMGATSGQIVDHINGDRADNRRENLRLCTHSENMRNRKLPKHNKLGVKGVYVRSNRFYAQIRCDGIKRHLGSFEHIDAAKAAYDAAAKSLHGEFARLS